MVNYQTIVTDVLVPAFTVGANIAFFICISSKVINMLIKAFHRGEIVV